MPLIDWFAVLSRTPTRLESQSSEVKYCQVAAGAASAARTVAVAAVATATRSTRQFPDSAR